MRHETLNLRSGNHFAFSTRHGAPDFGTGIAQGIFSDPASRKQARPSSFKHGLDRGAYALPTGSLLRQSIDQVPEILVLLPTLARLGRPLPILLLRPRNHRPLLDQPLLLHRRDRSLQLIMGLHRRLGRQHKPAGSSAHCAGPPVNAGFAVPSYGEIHAERLAVKR